jgi:hypothetical protein
VRSREKEVEIRREREREMSRERDGDRISGGAPIVKPMKPVGRNPKRPEKADP